MTGNRFNCLIFCTLLWVTIGDDPQRSDAGEDVTLRIRTLENDVPTPARIILRESSGEVVIPENRYKYFDSFVSSGEVVLDVTPGNYSLEVRRGLEYAIIQTDLVLEAGLETDVTVPQMRWIDLNARGWFGGDLHVHRPTEVIPQLMIAEDLNLCTVQSLWNVQSYWKNKKVPEELVQKIDDSHVYHVLSEEDERDGGAIMFYNLKSPINIAVPSRAYPSSLGFIQEALEQGAWVEEEKPFWWESPINVALGSVRSTEIVNNHFCENWILNNEAWGRTRDPEKYSSEPIGYCHYVLDLYYTFLNSGFPLIPTAGSATGVLRNPLGYNRCYVHCGDDFSYENWWEGLSEGKNFVTNGPALFVSLDGNPHWSRLEENTAEVQIRIEAVARDGISKIEIVGDGEILATHEPEGTPNKATWEMTLPCPDVSWLAVRAFEPAENTIRFAHTSPTYIDGRSSQKKKESAHFFIDWIDELIDRIEKDPERYETPEQLDEIRGEYQRARMVYAAIAEGE